VEAARIEGRAGAYALAAGPVRYALKRGDWRAAAQLAPRPSKFPFTDAIIVFARALGAARSGDPAFGALEPYSRGMYVNLVSGHGAESRAGAGVFGLQIFARKSVD